MVTPQRIPPTAWTRLLLSPHRSAAGRPPMDPSFGGEVGPADGEGWRFRCNADRDARRRGGRGANVAENKDALWLARGLYRWTCGALGTTAHRHVQTDVPH